MKKIIFLLAIACITLFACNPLRPGPKAVESRFDKADSIPASVAIDMINHYMDDKLVDHSLNSIVRRIDLNNSDLFKVFKLKNITRLRLFAAAYLDNDTGAVRRNDTVVAPRRNMVTVLVQLKQGYNSSYYYYDLGTTICPPPLGCRIYD